MTKKAKTNRKSTSSAAYREHRDIDLRGQCIQVALHMRKPETTTDETIRTAEKLASFVIEGKIPDLPVAQDNSNVVALKQ